MGLTSSAEEEELVVVVGAAARMGSLMLAMPSSELLSVFLTAGVRVGVSFFSSLEEDEGSTHLLEVEEEEGSDHSLEEVVRSTCSLEEEEDGSTHSSVDEATSPCHSLLDFGIAAHEPLALPTVLPLVSQIWLLVTSPE